MAARIPPITRSLMRRDRGMVISTAPRLRDRIQARVRPDRLDATLASGAPPEAEPALALRAQRLTEHSRRRAMAESLRSFVGQAQRERKPWSTRVLPSARAVLAAGEDLARLADALAEPGPVAAHGAAQAWILLTDGTGPLYDPHRWASLRADAARASENLRLR